MILKSWQERGNKLNKVKTTQLESDMKEDKYQPLDLTNVYLKIELAWKNAGFKDRTDFANNNKYGISKQDISHWRSGTKPSLEKLVAVSNACNCDIDFLLGRTNLIKRNNQPIHKSTGLSEEAIEVLRNANTDDRSDTEKSFFGQRKSTKTKLIDTFIRECDPIVEQVEKIIVNNAVFSHAGTLADKDGNIKTIDANVLYEAFKESFLKVYPPEEYPMLDGWDGLDEYINDRSELVKALLDMSIDAKKEDILKSFKGIIDKLLSGETALEDK